MSNVSNVCTSCGEKIVGLKYTHNGKSYCYACYQKLQEQLAERENQLQDLYKYIKGLFGILEIPDDILSYIDRELDNGKKIKGMQLTLKYYYEIQGNKPNNINNIIYILRDQYESARKYLVSMNKLADKNAEVDINVPPVNIKINPRNMDKKKKTSYNIEDL